MHKTAAFSGSLSHGATLLVLREDREVRTFLITKSDDSKVAAEHLADAVGATCSTTDLPIDELACGASGKVVTKMKQPIMFSSVQELDMAHASGALSRALGPHSWVAISMRNPKSLESNRHSRWVLSRSGSQTTTHRSTSTGAQVVSIMVGAPTRGEVKSLVGQIPGILGGFDYHVRPELPSAWPSVFVGLVLGVLSFTVGYLFLRSLLVPVLVGVGVFALGVLFGVLTVRSGALSGPAALKRIMKHPRFRLFPASKEKRDEHGVVTAPAAYPLHRDTFLLAPHQFVTIVAPQAGAVTGLTQTRARAMPQVFSREIGPMIGWSVPDEVPVHLDASESYSGVLALGEAGSGKTVLLHGLYAFGLLEKVAPSGRPGYPGRFNTLVAFENKGFGEAMDYVSWGQALGGPVVMFDLLDSGSFAIDMIPQVVGGRRLSVEDRATAFMEAMTYAFPPGSIMSRSRAQLVQVLAGGIVVAEHPELAAAAGLPTDKSFMYYTDVLCGRLDDDVAVLLANAIMSEAVRNQDADEDLVLAGELLLKVYGPSITKAKRATLLHAPQSKIAELMRVDAWWKRSRPRATWEQVLESHASVVLNVGRSREGVLVDGETAQILASMLLFTLKNAISITCSGWQQQGRHVSIFSDELSLISGSQPDVFRWLRDQGRSYGLELFFATQYAEQLDDSLANTVLGFGTLVAFVQGNPAMAQKLATIFASDGQEWDTADIINLPRFTAIVRGIANGSRQSAFTARLGFWEDSKGEYPFVQGYAGPPQGSTVSTTAVAQGPSSSSPMVFGQEV